MTIVDDDKPNGRTHEPALREVVADLDGLRDLMMEKFRALKELMNERHGYYTQRDKDRQSEVDKALAASDKQTTQAFAASKEATNKAAEAQDQYNRTHNDLLRKLADNMPRIEIEGRFRGLEEKVSELKLLVTGHSGTQAGSERSTRSIRADLRADIAIFVSVIAVLVMVWMS